MATSGRNIFQNGKQILLFSVICVFFVLLNACGDSRREQALQGSWAGYVNVDPRLMNIEMLASTPPTEYVEFFEDGTISIRNTMANFIGDYRFVDDDTIRVDLKEQGAVGNSPTILYRVQIEGDMLTLMSETSGQFTRYFRVEALQKTTTAYSSVDFNYLIGAWEDIEVNQSESTREVIEFRVDQTFRALQVTSEGETRTAEGVFSVSANSITLQVQDSSSGSPLVGNHYFGDGSIKILSAIRLTPEELLVIDQVNVTTEFRRTQIMSEDLTTSAISVIGVWQAEPSANPELQSPVIMRFQEEGVMILENAEGIQIVGTYEITEGNVLQFVMNGFETIYQIADLTETEMILGGIKNASKTLVLSKVE